MRNRYIIGCKIAQKEAGLNDEQYRKILFQAAGISSSKDIIDDSQYMAILSALNGLVVKPTQPKPKYVDPWAKPPIKWKWCDATEEQWSNFGALMDAYEKQGIILVGVWQTDGRKRFKWRKK
jgi:hypothetical protein